MKFDIDKIYELDDIGFVGTQEPMSREYLEWADNVTRAFIAQDKAQRTPEENEYHSAFGGLLQAIERYKTAKSNFSRTAYA